MNSKRFFFNSVPDMNSEPSDILAITRAFVVLEFLGGVGMGVLLCTAFFSRAIQRRRTWYSFCISWVISSFSYCLSFFAGQQFSLAEQPSYGVCLLQAVLIYASPPLTAATTLALLLDVWWILRVAMSGKSSRNGHVVLRCLLFFPYFLWFVLAVGHLIYGALNPTTVRRDLRTDPYCIIQNPVPPVLVSSLVVLFACLILVMLVVLSVRLRRSRRQVPPATRNAQSNANAQLKSLIVRLVAFSFLAMTAVIIGVVFAFNRAAGLKYDLASAIIPPSGVVIFGTQKDLLQEWSKLFHWLLELLRSMRRICSHQKSTHHFDTAHPNKTLHSNETETEAQEITVLDITRSDEIVLVSPRRVPGRV